LFFANFLPAIFSVAVLETMVPTFSALATHWYRPSSGRLVRLCCTVEKYSDPLERSRLKHAF
jgi:hypothetical protein